MLARNAFSAQASELLKDRIKKTALTDGFLFQRGAFYDFSACAETTYFFVISSLYQFPANFIWSFRARLRTRITSLHGGLKITSVFSSRFTSLSPLQWMRSDKTSCFILMPKFVGFLIVTRHPSSVNFAEILNAFMLIILVLSTHKGSTDRALKIPSISEGE